MAQTIGKLFPATIVSANLSVMASRKLGECDGIDYERGAGWEEKGELGGGHTYCIY